MFTESGLSKALILWNFGEMSAALDKAQSLKVGTKSTIEGLCIKGRELYFGIVNSMSNIHIVSVPLVNISEWAIVSPM